MGMDAGHGDIIDATRVTLTTRGVFDCTRHVKNVIFIYCIDLSKFQPREVNAKYATYSRGVE